MFLDGINTGMIPTQGTAIADALSVSLNSFSKQKGVKRAIVVITDGEDHQGGVDDVVKELKNNNISVYVLGIGDTKGSPIKIGNDYLRDINGQTVISRLNEQMCKDIANKTNGTYIHVDNSNSAQEQLLDELNHIQRTNFETATYEDYNELFPWLIMIAMILICVEVLIQYHGNNIISRLKGVKHSDNILRLVIFVLVTSLSTVAMGQLQSKVLTHKGNVAFNAKHDSMAIINYKKALAIDKDNYKAHFNLGNTFLRQGKGQEAMAEYEKGAKASPSRLVKKAIYHNMGYIYYIAGKYDKAVDAFKQALLAEPKDDRTRYDLAMAQYMLKKNPKQSGGSNSKQKDKGNQNQENKSKNNNSNSDSKQQSEENISKQNTEQMLRAVQMKEKQTQEKLKHKHRQNSRQYIEKNW